MIIQDPRVKAKCPECGSENVQSKLSLTTIVAWAGKFLGVPTVKICEKRCAECGSEFQKFFGNNSEILLKSRITVSHQCCPIPYCEVISPLDYRIGFHRKQK